MMSVSSFGRVGIPLLLAVSVAVSVIGGGVVLAETVSEDSGGDAGDTRANATVLGDKRNSSIDGTIASSDADWYAVKLDEGQSFSVQIERGEKTEYGALRTSLYGPEGKLISVHTVSRSSRTPVATEGTNGQTFPDKTVDQSGTYYVKVTIVGGSVRKKVPYTLVITPRSPDEDDSNEDDSDENDSDDRSSKAVPIESGQTVRGTITGDNRKYFTVKANRSDIISIETTFTPPESAGTVYVYGPGGKRIRTSSDGDIQRITAENSGMYTIELVSDSRSGSTVEFTLTATLSSNQSRGPGGARRITVGKSVSSTITSNGETDWYTVEIEKGQGFTVLLEHTNRKKPTAEMTFEIYNPKGEQVGEVPFDRPLRAYQTSPAAASAYGGDVAKYSGTYYIAVKGKKGAKYSLTANNVKLDTHDPNEQPASATSISRNDTVSGLLTGYDRDVYAIDLQKGETVSVKYNSTGAVKPSLWVAGPGITNKSIEDYSFGKHTIASSGVEDRLTFTANRTGTYYIKMVPYPERSTAATFFQNATYELTVSLSKKNKGTLTVNRLRTPTVPPSTETVTLNTSVRTVTRTPTPTPTPTSTPTQTPTPTPTSTPTQTSTATVTPRTTTAVITATPTANEMPSTTTTTANGPGFGVLLALVSFSGGAWWYRSQQ